MTAGKHSVGWMILELLTSVIIFLVISTYLSSDDYTVSSSSPPYEHIRVACTPGYVASKAAKIISNYSHNHTTFLQLSDYFWTVNKSLYSLPYGTKGSELEIMQALALTQHYHLPQEIERLECRRCVVVGNGNRLKNSSLGEIIDRYNIVIRLNNAPVHNYEKDVGTKTTMRLFYPESAFFDLRLDANPETLMVLVPYKRLDLQWLKTILNNEKRIKKGFWKKPPMIWDVNPENLRILNPYYMEVAALRLLGLNKKNNKLIKPTTGLMAISFAIHFCDLVHIAGFGYPAPTNKTEFVHYYDKTLMKQLLVSEHKVPLEAIAIKKLLKHNVIHNLTYF
ncbi:CMP-N-acetylneuraminate-beta-galactosamide-alpha-2,3-sialyltransferase 4-like [Hyla sarda]|uniref:CMP-N-acetylneuraminate-beta-galactosamide- alpha-2,3-sialyltransferase 4-like n=1 Tax=Hyla sarda TaxID=327740 RepID=UPI0024C30D7F|nr:CMP-N-acetylneuraminate-beta-galactosamide-alpha-2,3-sialyltransferase 4-like [Hyla sarda]